MAALWNSDVGTVIQPSVWCTELAGGNRPSKNKYICSIFLKSRNKRVAKFFGL
jgi:hypothetical protein